ncbi:MAG: ester cyclase [Chloroflexi bacterium]|nr:ester cyclase [Chloroflexota bacterium]
MKKVLKVSLILVVAIALGVYALNSVVNGADDPTPAERMERFQKVLDEVYLKGNLDALDELYAPDVVIHNLNRPDTIGLDALKETTKGYRLLFSECRMIFDELFVSGDRIITQFTFQGTYAGERNLKWIFQSKETGESQAINTSASAGEQFTLKGCHIDRLVNEKFVETWTYWDTIVPTLTAAGIELKMEPIVE